MRHERPLGKVPGVIDEDRDWAEGLLNIGHCSIESLFVGDIRHILLDIG